MERVVGYVRLLYCLIAEVADVFQNAGMVSGNNERFRMNGGDCDEEEKEIYVD